MQRRTTFDPRRSRVFALAVTSIGALACASSPRAVPTSDAPVGAQPAAAQRTPGAAEVQGAFVVRLGNDTVAVERYTRTSRMLEGELILRVPRTRVIAYRAELGMNGHVSTFEARATQPGGAPSQPTRLEFTGNTVVARIPSGDSLRVNRIPVQGIAVPWIGNSFALAEQAIMQALPAGRDSTTVLQMGLGGQTPTAVYLRRRGATGVELEYFGSPVVIRLDGAGRIQSADGSATASKITVERVPTVNIAALATDFAARPLGQLSTRDTTLATIGGGAMLSVDYGRPSARGRTIWGGVVPWNEPWRTGANEATHFTTSRDLVIGGTTVPAGTYTLWTIPSPTGAQLVINRQTGQWGTVYDPAQDLARIAVTMEPLSEPVEQFTIAIVPSASGGVMRLMWGDRGVVVPFTVR